MASIWRRLRQATRRQAAAAVRGKRAYRPWLERLEQRLAPATKVWVGGAIDASTQWSVGFNWEGGTAPANGDDLVFGNDGEANSNTLNDIPNLAVNSITFLASSYILGGNALSLGAGGITSTASGTGPLIGLPLILTNAQTFANFGTGLLQFTSSVNLNGHGLTINDENGNVTFTATNGITGAGSLNVVGPQTLTLQGSNNYTGQTFINNGVVNVLSNTGLGATGPGNDTLVSNRGVLQFGTGSTGGNNLAEALTLSGFGPFGLGSLVNGTGNNTVSGAITLNANTEIFNQTSGATLTIAGPVTFAAATELDTQGSNITFTGGISGPGSIFDLFTNTLTFGGTPSTYTGSTTIDGGEVAVSVANALPTGTALTLENNATVDLQGNHLTVGSLASFGTNTITNSNFTTPAMFTDKNSGNDTYGGLLTGSLALEEAGTGTLTLTNTGNTYTGGTVMTNGTLIVSADADLGSAAGGLTLNGGTFETTASFSTSRTITVNLTGGVIFLPSGTTLTATGQVTGPGTLTKSGLGTLILTNTSNNYTGGTTVLQGTLSVAADADLGNPTGLVTLNGGTLATTATFSTNRSFTLGAGGSTFDVASGTTLTITGLISGAALTKIDSGTLTLTGVNTYSVTTISGGTLQIGNGGTTGTLGSGAVTDNANLTFDRSDTPSVGNNISGSGSLTQAGIGTTILTNANSYLGTTMVTAGTLADGVANALPAGTALTVTAPGIFDLASFAQTVASVTGTGTVTDSGGPAPFVVNNAAADTFAGTLTGASLSLAKTGAGASTLASTNTYGGATTVSAGTLLVDGSTATASAVTVSAGTLGGTGTINGTISDSATLDPGDAPGGVANPGILSTGAVTFNSGSTFRAQIGGPSPGTYDQLLVNGTLALGAGNATLNVSSFGNFTPAAGSEFDLIVSTGGVTGTFAGLAEGATFSTNFLGSGLAAFITYRGGANGKAVALVLSGPLNFSSEGGALTLLKNGSNVEIRDALNNVLASRLLASVTSITITGANNVGNSLTIDYNFGGVFTIPNGITYNGGTGTGATNSLAIVGGAFNTDTYTYTSAHNGAVQLGLGGQLVTYTNLTPLLNTGTATDIVFNLPTGTVGASLQDDGTPGNNTSQLASTNASFETTTFTDPTNSLTVNAGGGIDTIATAANFSGDFHATLIVNGTPATDTVTLNALNLTGGLSVTALTTNVLNNITTTTGQTYNSSVILNTASGTLSLAAGGTITFASTVNGAQALTITGNASLGGAVGGATPLLSLSVSGTTALNGGSVITVGDQTYTGLVTLGAGTVVNTATLSMPGGVQLNANSLTVNDSGAGTIAGPITGAGGLTKQSTGTLTLTGANTYSGATTISAGTLQVGNAGTTGTLGTGPVTDNGTLTFDRTDIITVANAISGTGTLTQAGAGTTILTGANTYAGTTISAGTLQIGNGDSSGTLGTGAVTDNGALSFNRSDTITVANAISGTGTLTQAGTGTTILIGSNSYSGLTTISGGTLQIGNGGIAGTLGTGVVTDNANLTFDRTDTITVANAIGGSGSVTQAGTGTTILTSINGYSGGTIIAAGTLQINNDNELGAPTGGLTLSGGRLATTANVATDPNRIITVSAASTIDIASNTTLTLGGAINGSGNLTKTNTGHLFLDGSGDYAGTLNFANGILLVNGNEPNATFIVNGSTFLGGIGKIGPLSGASGASLSPGRFGAIVNDPGTFSSGNGTDLTGFTFDVELDGAASSQYDSLDVTGNANLGGITGGGATLNLNISPTFPTTVGTGNVFTLVSTTGTLSGTFAGLPQDTVFTVLVNNTPLTFQIHYGSNAVTLTYLNTPPSNVTVTPAPGTVNENDQVNVSGTFIDPNPLDTHTVTIDWGDGTPPTVLQLPAGVLTYNTATTVPPQPHRYLDNQPGNAPYTITVTVTDSNGGRGTGTAPETVNNVAPANVVLTPTPSPSNENDAITLNGSFTDPGTLDTHTVVITWGDGSQPTTLNLAANVLTFSTTHPYLDNLPNNAPYTISATVTDKDGGSGMGGAQQVVNNVAPSNVVLTPTPSPSNENDTVTLNGSFVDPGTLDTHVVVINWGDGSGATTLNLPAGVVTFQTTHRYLDNQPSNAAFTISATVTDKDGGTGTGSVSQVVNNVAPANVILTFMPASINENDTVTLNGSFTDPGTLDTHTVVITWGDGSQPTTLNLAANVLTFSTTHPYLDNQASNAPYAVTATVTDQDGAAGSGSGSLPVFNVAPSNVVVTPGANPINENDTVTVNGSFVDPGTLDTHTVVITWGDGTTSPPINLAANVLTFSASHKFLDNQPNNAPFTITATVTDKDGGSASGSSNLTVNNVAPSGVTLTFSPASINENGTVTLNGSFTDPGTLDTHTVLIDWKDGSPTTTLNLPAGQLTFSAMHQYLDNGTFAVSALVTDKDGASATGTGPLSVANVPPSNVTVITAPNPSNENGLVTLIGSFADPGTLDTHTVVISWGDNSASTTLNLAAGVFTFSATHTYLDNQTVAVTAVVTDKDGGSGSGAVTQTVLNVVPMNVTLSLAPNPIVLNAPVTVSGLFTDPGTLDTHTVAINWGDGTAVTTVNLPANQLTFTATHTFTATNVAAFTVSATVTDKDGGTSVPGNATALVQGFVSTPPTNVQVGIENLPPENVAPLNAPVNLVASVAGLPSGDGVQFNWNVTNHDGNPFASGTGTNFGFVPTVSGPYVVTLVGTDVVTGHSASTTTTINAGATLNPDIAFVEALYRDVLHRAPDDPGLNSWVSQLEAGTLSPAQVAQGFVRSAEGLGVEVGQLYQQILHRQADAFGLNAFVTALQNGVSVATVVQAMVTSPEFTALFPDNGSFVEALYERVLGRAPGTTSAGELAAQTNALNSGQSNRALMALTFENSPEEFVREIDLDYIAFLGRGPDPMGQQAFFSLLSGGQIDPLGLEAAIVGSPEYFLRNTGTR